MRYRSGRIFDEQDAGPAANENRVGNSRHQDVEESSTYVFTGQVVKKQKDNSYEDDEDNPRKRSFRQRRSPDDYESISQRRSKKGRKGRVNSWEDDE